MVKRTITLLVLVVLSIVLAACGSEEPDPTPTPTKTPLTAVQPATPTPLPPPTQAPAQSGSQPAQGQSEQPPPASKPASETVTIGTVTADLLNIRSDPNTDGTIVTTATTGQKFTVVGRNQDGTWLQLADNGKLLGWAVAEFLQVEQQVANGEEGKSPPAQSGGQAAVATPVAPPPSAAPAVGNMRSPDFGGQAFLWWRPEVADRDLKLMREGGFNWVKQAFAWETIERTGKGAFDWTVADRVVSHVNQSGLQLLARLSSDPDLPSFWAGAPPANADNFADFAFAVASRYNCAPGAVGCIQAYQIWNEPNLAREWGGNRPNPAQYIEFLRKAYAAIKRANPNAIVISAGMAPTGSNDGNAMPDDIFYEEMYKAMGGNSNCCFDMLGVHGAGFAAPPELDPATAAADKPKYGGYRFFAFRHVEDIRNIMVQYGDTNKKIVLLEFGWTFDPVNPDYKWHGADAGIDQFVQGDYLKRAYVYAAQNWQPWIGLMNLLTMPNLDWTNDGNAQDEEQYWWAIMEPSPIDQLNFRAAYIILCDHFNRQIGQPCPHDPALKK